MSYLNLLLQDTSNSLTTAKHNDTFILFKEFTNVSSSQIICSFAEQMTSITGEKKVLADALSEIYLWYVQLLINVFHNLISTLVRKEHNSLIGIVKILSSLQDLVQERKDMNFMPLTVTDMIEHMKSDGYKSKVHQLQSNVETPYEECLWLF